MIHFYFNTSPAMQGKTRSTLPLAPFSAAMGVCQNSPARSFTSRRHPHLPLRLRRLRLLRQRPQRLQGKSKAAASPNPSATSVALL